MDAFVKLLVPAREIRSRLRHGPGPAPEVTSYGERRARCRGARLRRSGPGSRASASTSGADVLLLERNLFAGGTTAISGGVVWAPANHLMAQAGIPDSDVDAVGYLSRIDRGGDAKLRIEFVQDAPRVVKLLEERTQLRWEMLEHWPDYHSEERGALWAAGHCGRRR